MNGNTNRTQKWTQEELDILKTYFKSESSVELTKRIPNRTPAAIIQKAERLHLKHNFIKGHGKKAMLWTNEETELLKSLYENHPIDEVMRFFPNRTKSAVQQQANTLGLRYLYYNERFFQTIDTAEKAYWLGFIYADGCVTTRNRFSLELAIVDKDHLQKFCDALESNIRIHTRACRPNNLVPSSREICSIMINNSRLWHDLYDKGVVRQKTFCLKFPDSHQLPVAFYRDFIRGFFDGDGSYMCTWHQNEPYRGNDGKIRRRSYYAKSISVVCTERQFLEKISQILFNYANCKSSIGQHGGESRITPLYTLRVYSKKDLTNFIKFVFYEGCVCLDRKYAKAKKILDNCLS